MLAGIGQRESLAIHFSGIYAPRKQKQIGAGVDYRYDLSTVNA
jgi:hypothetical protein